VIGIRSNLYGIAVMTAVPPLELSETEYLMMEEALSQTARGRAFLRMRDRRVRVVGADELQRIAIALERQIDRLSGTASLPSPSSDGRSIAAELTAITHYVQEARSDIRALRPADTGANRIDAATGELDAIVAATERATTDILSATEHISEWTQRIPRGDPEMAEIADAIEAWSIEIMTSCSFQDITGQRTTKVVNTLRYIEQRVNTMIEIWGVDKSALTTGAAVATSHRKLDDTRPDAHLLNGPQLEGEGVSQEDIDSLFDNIASAMPEVFERAEAVAEPPYTPPPEKPAVLPRPSAAPKNADGPDISQADIDALFG
jgi:chemotaxis regulatin CheY-phosphate phosphatase CheZ